MLVQGNESGGDACVVLWIVLCEACGDGGDLGACGFDRGAGFEACDDLGAVVVAAHVQKGALDVGADGDDELHLLVKTE